MMERRFINLGVVNMEYCSADIDGIESMRTPLAQISACLLKKQCRVAKNVFNFH